MKTLFELNDTLYAEAQIEENGEVYLWLGVRPHLSLTSSFLPSPFYSSLRLSPELTDGCGGVVS
jgi:hypothetical protein